MPRGVRSHTVEEDAQPVATEVSLQDDTQPVAVGYDFLADIAANATVAPKVRKNPRRVSDVHPAIRALVHSVATSGGQEGFAPFTDKARELEVRDHIRSAAADLGKRPRTTAWEQDGEFKGLRFTVSDRRPSGSNGSDPDVNPDGDDS